MVSPMKLFRRSKPKVEQVVQEPEEESIVKLTESASTEASSDVENPANKDVLEGLVEEQYDPEDGRRLMLLQSISYETNGDRYALTKGCGPRECRDDDSSEEDEYSQSRDSTFYTNDTQPKQPTVPKKKINQVYKIGSKMNVIKNSWSLKSADSSIDENNIYHSEIHGPLPSNSSMPSFLKRVESTPLDIGPSDPPGQILDKYRRINGVLSNEVSVLSMHGAEEKANRIQASESTGTSTSNHSSSRKGSSASSSSYLSSSMGGSLDSQSTISGDKSQTSNNRWGWLSKPTSSFLQRRKKEPMEDTPETKEYNKHRDAMQFQTAPSFVTGTFVSQAGEEAEQETRDDEGAVECMIVPERALPDLPERKNLPPTPRKSDDDEGDTGFPEVFGEHFNAMKQYWQAQATSNGHAEIPRPPTFVDPDTLSANLSMEEQILMNAMSMGSMDVIPVPRQSRKSLLPAIFSPTAVDSDKPTEVSIQAEKSRSKKKEKLDFSIAARSKEEAVEVAVEPKRSKFSKLKDKISSGSSSSSTGSQMRKGVFQKKLNYFEAALKEDDNVVRELKGLFRKKKKTKYFEGVLEEDDVVEEPVVKMKGLFRRKKKTKRFEGVLEEDDMVEEPVAVLKGRLRTPASLQSQAGMGKTTSKKKVEPVVQRKSKVARPDPLEVDPLMEKLKERLRTPRAPLSPQSPASMAKNDQFSEMSSEAQSFGSVPRDVMIHPDLGQDTMEEERVADEIVGFVKLMPVALMSFFKKNPNEDDLILSLAPSGRIPKRGGSSLSSRPHSRRSGVMGQSHHQESFLSEVSESSTESSSSSLVDSQKQMNFTVLTPSSVPKDLYEDKEGAGSDRTEKRRGGIFRKAFVTPRNVNSPRANQRALVPKKETIEEMAEKEVKQKIEEGVEMIAGVTRQGQKAIVISNTKRHPIPEPEDDPEQVYHA